jgi:lantibiotic modifying enzyme
MADAASAAVDDIAQALLRGDCEPVGDASLATGHTGLALFFGCLAAARQDEALADAASDRLSDALRTAAGASLGAGLHSGLTGVCWGTRYLDELLSGEPETDATRDLDEWLIQALGSPSWDAPFDLMYGLAGIACYAADHSERDIGSRLAAPLVGRLESLAASERGGLTWRLPAARLPEAKRALCSAEGYTDLGVAHGIAGVIGALARLCAADLEAGRARRLLDGAVAWLLASRRAAESGSTFSYFSFQDVSCRSAWCYGDPGIAAALLLAAEAAGEPPWRDEAVAIARRDCARPLEDAQVLDAELCHGAAGLGHLYNRLYQATGDETFAAAARSWMERTLAMRRPGAPAGGFHNYWQETDAWHSEAGLLVGASGVGLGLLAATTALAPGWDRCLLLSSA